MRNIIEEYLPCKWNVTNGVPSLKEEYFILKEVLDLNSQVQGIG
jgi:hypothetical protein